MLAIRGGDGLRARLPLSPLRSHRLEFGLDDLHDVRSLVAVAGAAAGLSPRRVSDLVAAASELAANSVLYGGGRGLATAWDEGGAVLVEVADAGTIRDPEVGRVRPEPTVEHGRGLYIANQLCDDVSIDSGPTGTRVRLRMEVAAG
ncbi:MAG: ATP-binding protein [Actinobacteria bacterium]|nr:ATP-binding protein [Actinomycetota bacterium]